LCAKELDQHCKDATKKDGTSFDQMMFPPKLSSHDFHKANF
jgi:hypothetical protein